MSADKAFSEWRDDNFPRLSGMTSYERDQFVWLASRKAVEESLAAANARWQAPDYSNFAELLQPPFQHTRSCPSLTPGNDVDCTCGLQWRIEVSTLMTLLSAWQKRAAEAESAIDAAIAAKEKPNE